MNSQQSIRLTACGTIDRRIKSIPFATNGPLFWYFVGLVATDGCLYNDRRHIGITSIDQEHLINIQQQLQLRSSVTPQTGGKGRQAYHIQIGSRLLFDKLLDIGLTPKKSLTLGPLDVPEGYFHDFVRGVIDGDGNIRRWVHPTNRHDQWAIRIASAAPRFIRWLQSKIDGVFQVKGVLLKEDRAPHAPGYVLKYGKLAAKVILRRCYYSGALALPRKQLLANECISAHVGWSTSKTVTNADEHELWTYSRKPYAQEEPGWRNWRNALDLKSSGV